MKKTGMWRSLGILGLSCVLGLVSNGCSSAGDMSLSERDSDPGLIETHDAALLPASCTALGNTINAHTCTHGPSGPYGSVTASSNPSFAGATPKFSGIHRYFTVTLPSVGGGLYRGTVKFTPANDDDHVVYVKPSVTVTVKDKSGTLVSSQLSSVFATCPAYLTNYAVYELKKSSSFAPYKLTFEATTSAIQVALEEVKPMREHWYPDADLDGYGPASPSEFTACVPSPGYLTTTSGDCNDANASVYPGNGCP
jgi:hypothetical protein